MIDVLGRDVALEAYKVAVSLGDRRIVAFVPERHFNAARRPSHQEAYEGIVAAKSRIEKAILALADDRPAPAPFDDITLAEEV